MYASVTNGHTTAEIRPTRRIPTSDGEPRTIRIRPGRANTRRAAIAEQTGTYR